MSKRSNVFCRNKNRFRNNSRDAATVASNLRSGRRLSRLAMGCAVTGLATLGAGATLAQDGALEEIVVTAQFRSQNLQQTPIAITAFNAETMEARSQTSIYEVSAQAPNVTLKPQGAAFGPSLSASIRGVGQYDFNPAYEPGVGLYIDDIYYATLTGSIFDLLDLERVEILRGPQGTLAGKNSIGGAIKLYSKLPAGDNSGSIQATYGARNRIDLRGSADFALSDSLFARVSGVSRNQEGYVDRYDYGCLAPTSGVGRQLSASTDCLMAKEGQVNYDAMRAMLHFDNGGPITATLIGDYTNEDRTTAASVLTYANYTGTRDINPYATTIALDSRFVPPPGSYFNYASFMNLADGTQPLRVADGRSSYRGWGMSGKIDWDLTETLKLESITAYREYDSGFSNDNDLSPLAHSLGDGSLDFWSFSQEVRLSGSFGSDRPIDWTIGGFYMDQQSVYASYQDLRYAGLAPFEQHDPVNADNLSFFAHASWRLLTDLTLIGGLRYTDESKDYTFVRRSPDGTTHPSLSALDNKIGTYSGDRIDYRVGLQYEWNDSVMSYVQVATGYKGGGINPRPFFATQVQPFGPEKLTSYEMGVKSELFERTLRLNAAAFYSEYEDIQLTANSCPDFTPTPSGSPCALPINAGDAHVKGIEFEANYQPNDNLIFDSAVSYLDFDYQRVNPRAGGVDLTDVPPYTPNWKWSAGVQYQFVLSDLGYLVPRFDVSYQDSIFTTASNSAFGAIESYVVANARLTWRNQGEDWEAAFEVTNLFNKYYFQTMFDQVSNNGVASGQPGRPREWALTIKKRF